MSHTGQASDLQGDEAVSLCGFKLLVCCNSSQQQKGSIALWVCMGSGDKGEEQPAEEPGEGQVMAAQRVGSGPEAS